METPAFVLPKRPIIPVAEGNKTGLTLFMLGKSILADTHLLCLADTCSLFNYFHQEFFQGQFPLATL